MIVKKVGKMKKAGGGSFGGLANYIMDLKNEGEKARDHEFSNCNFGDDYNMNIQEITAVQKYNTAAKNDKTYHMIVSFQEDETPSLETMRSIESELVKSLGFENHQRLSVIHDNTNNLHIHIAINRIDPETFLCKDPFRDIHTLQTKAIELEEKYQLKRTNHTTKDKEPTHIKDKEIHSGITSFLSWIKEDVGTEIKEILKDKTKSFEDLQKTLNKYNLELRERGAGLVISDKDRSLFVKASDIDRSLSKSALNKRFGEFKPSRIDEPAITKFGAKTSSLWDEYQSKTKEQRSTKKELLEKLSSKGTNEFTELKDDYTRRRNIIKKDPTLKPRVKRLAYKMLSDERAKEFTELKEKIGGERTAIFKDNQFKTYTEFLQERASGGDVEALKTLQRKESKKSQAGNVIELVKEVKGRNQKILPGQKPNITKSGIVFYNIKGGKIIETQSAVKITKEINPLNIKEYLDLAKMKFGTINPVKIKGDKKFIKAVTEINKEVGLLIKEKNELLPKSKLEQIKQRIGEKHNASRGRFTANSDKGRFECYITSSRTYFDGVTEQLKNVIGHFRDIGRTGADTIRERIVDVFIAQDRTIGDPSKTNTNFTTRTTTDRERNGTIQSTDGKSNGISKIKKGVERQ